MKGDFTRSTFNRKKHYSSVRLQQGRVHLDADTNEQSDIFSYHSQTEARDVIGMCGAPLDYAGFSLSDGAVPVIGEGRYYVDGILCENDADTALNAQIDRPGYALESAQGRYLAYLDVWQRHLTALDDERIRETALGGPDTATRTKTVWQVRLMSVAAGTTCASASTLPDWTKLTAPNLGKLQARARQREQTDDLCSVEPGGGYRRLENQLYRVEIHDPGTLGNGQATFKWSRENGAVVTKWDDQDGNILIVSDPGRDEAHGFAPGQWVELSDNTLELEGKPGTLVQLANVEGQMLTISAPAGSIQRANFPRNPKIRRWESAGKLKVEAPSANEGYLSLEDGVEIKFAAGEYRTGDYWLVPARSALGTVEWEPDPANPAVPAAQERHGIRHHYCRLAILDRNSSGFTVVEDCRALFPPITELTTLFYLGGDGQQMMPAASGLPHPLRVGVARGSRPLANATIQFVAERNGRLATTIAGLPASSVATIPVQTDANGVAECAWKLDSDAPTLSSQHVLATLLDLAGNPASNPPIRFAANLSIAREVAYDPSACPDLTGVTNVQDAIDQLCKRPSGGGGCCETTIGENGEFATIEEALKVLLGRGEEDICLCLLPGEHKTTSGLPMLQDAASRSVHVRIGGCGSSTRLLISEAPWLITRLGSFQMERLDVHIETPETALQIAGCREVTFHSCAIRGAVGKGALVAIREAGRILIEDNQIATAGGEPEMRPGEILRAFEPVSRLFMSAFQTEEEFRRAALRAASNLAHVSPSERRALVEPTWADIEGARDRMDNDMEERYRRFLEAASAEAVDIQLMTNVLADLRASAQAPGLALIIGDAEADTMFDNNRIAGVVSLYGEPGQIDLNRDQLHLFAELMRASDYTFTPSSSRLHMHDNHLFRLVAGGERVEQILKLMDTGGGQLDAMYKTAFLTDNLFDGGRNFILVQSLALTSNSFDPLDQPNLGAALAWSATYVGNQALDEYVLVNASRADAKAANLTILIEDA